MCKKQTSVSHSSTQSEVISLDAALRVDGFLALDLWDIVIAVLRSTNNKVQPKHTSHQETGAVLDSKTKTQHDKTRQKVEQLNERIYFFGPDDIEYPETLKNARRKLERTVAPAMPCKRQTSIVKANAKPKIGNEKKV